MLQELVRLPHRDESNYVMDTSVYLFNNNYKEMYEHLDIYGRPTIGNSAGWNMFDKFKSIELYGNDIVERLLMVNDDIDFQKPWWTSESIKIFAVLQSKYFDRNTKRTYVAKHNTGIAWCVEEGMLETSDGEKPIYNLYDQFLYTLSLLSPKGSVLNNVSPKLLYHSTNDDIRLVNTLSKYEFNTDEFLNLDYNKHSVNEYEKICGSLQNMSNLVLDKGIEPWVPVKRFVNPMSNVGLMSRNYQDYVNSLNPLFEPYDTQYSSSVEYSWSLLELLYKLNESYYTNVRMDYSAKGDTVSIEGLNIYDRRLNPLTSENRLLSIVFKNWILEIIKSGRLVVDKVKLIKLPTEEVFINLYQGGKIVYRHYFDLVYFIIGSIAIT